jgi:nitrogen fixation NifU-like protein
VRSFSLSRLLGNAFYYNNWSHLINYSKYIILKLPNSKIFKFSNHTAMAYSDKLLDHFNNPRNVGTLDKEKKNVGTGLVGAPECGDVMRLQIEVDDNGLITDAKFKTFGCGSAIASSSLATEWLKGKSLSEASGIDNMDIVEELELPPVKIHCSVLAEDAIKAAIKDYQEKNGFAG